MTQNQSTNNKVPNTLIKYRPLRDEHDFERIKEIIETKKLWCDKLWNLNDAMEGIYETSSGNLSKIKNLFTDKNRYVICSLSHKDTLDCPLLWGYYANGYKGIAIEIEINNPNCIKEINYEPNIQYLKKLENDAEKIITTKLDCWTHEKEYRYLKKGDRGNYEIGRIMNVYFGMPYFNANNKKDIIQESKHLRNYYCLKMELEAICKENNVKTEEYMSDRFKCKTSSANENDNQTSL